MFVTDLLRGARGSLRRFAGSRRFDPPRRAVARLWPWM
jgi:hypothetical protein